MLTFIYNFVTEILYVVNSVVFNYYFYNKALYSA